MNRWLNELAAIGWPPLATLALFAIALAIYFSAVVPARSGYAALEERVELEREKARRIGKQATQPTVLSPQAELQRFRNFFPPLNEVNEWVDEIYAAARRERLSLQRGEYKLIPEREAGLVRYQIVLPLKGSYPQIRRFIAEVLEEVPAAAIDDVSIRREKIGDASVEARLRLNLYMRAEDSSGVAGRT